MNKGSYIHVCTDSPESQILIIPITGRLLYPTSNASLRGHGFNSPPQINTSLLQKPKNTTRFKTPKSKIPEIMSMDTLLSHPFTFVWRASPIILSVGMESVSVCVLKGGQKKRNSKKKDNRKEATRKQD